MRLCPTKYKEMGGFRVVSMWFPCARTHKTRGFRMVSTWFPCFAISFVPQNVWFPTEHVVSAWLPHGFHVEAMNLSHKMCGFLIPSHKMQEGLLHGNSTNSTRNFAPD